MLLFAGSAEAGMTGGASGGGAAPPPVLAAGPVATMARIRGGAAGGVALWWWSGQLFGRRRGERTRPLLRLTGIGFSRMTATSDGGWQLAMSEAGFYTDFETGAFVREWVNPYTGRKVTPPVNRLVIRYAIGADGRVAPPFPGMDFDGRIGPVDVQGDTVWVAERLMAWVPPPPAGTPPRGPVGSLAETSSFQARLADLAAPETVAVPATLQHQAAWPFYPWLDMPGDEGETLTHIIGRKLAGPAELPAPLRERVEGEFPGLLANPGV